MFLAARSLYSQTKFPMSTKQKKSPARPKRTVTTVPEEHPVGLWVDKELLRKHTQQKTPKTILHGNSEAAGNRYLELADIMLGNKRKKRSSHV